MLLPGERFQGLFMIPFTIDEFLNVFARYNLAVWPAQIFLYAIGLVAIYLALSQKRDFSKSVSLILSAFWIWMGVVYHSWFFSAINRTAYTFATFFILQGIFFLIAGVWTDRLKFHVTVNFHGIIGGLFIVYALITYPALAYCFGHRYPAGSTFGLPCPTTIFTFGMLLWTVRPVPLFLLAIPLAWSFIGFWAAISLGMTEDVGLLAAGLLAAMLIIWRDSTLHTNAPART
jgi:hypothetical protein